MDEYLFYPELSEEGKKEAQQLIESFKTNLIKVAGDAINALYCDITLAVWLVGD